VAHHALLREGQLLGGQRHTRDARAELTGARLLIEQLKSQLAVLRRMQFGRSSEKLNAEIQQLELLLEDLEEGEAERIAPTTATAEPLTRGAPPAKACVRR
jgi:hypothetical protein